MLAGKCGCFARKVASDMQVQAKTWASHLIVIPEHIGPCSHASRAGCDASPSDVETEQRNIRGPRYKLKRLHRVEGPIKVSGRGLVCQKKRRGDEDEKSVGGDQRHLSFGVGSRRRSAR